MVYRAKGESTALISPSPLLRSLLPPSFPFLFLLQSSPPTLKLPSSHFLLFFILKKQTVFCISNKPSLSLPSPPIWHLVLFSPPFPHVVYSRGFHLGNARVMCHGWSKGRSWVQGTVGATTTLYPIVSASALLSSGPLNFFPCLSCQLKAAASHQGWFSRYFPPTIFCFIWNFL